MITANHSQATCDVLHVIPYMHPQAGGPPVVVERMVSRLAVRGWSNRVVCTDAYVPPGQSEWRTNLDPALSVTVHPRAGKGGFAYSGSLAADLQDSVAASRLVHIHTLWSHSTIAAARACLRRRVPFVVMPHGMLDPNSLRRGWLKKQAYGRLVEWPVLRRAQGMIYTHRVEEELANSAVASLPRGFIVPLGTDDPPESQRQELAAEFLFDHPHLRGKTLVTFLSRLHSKKGLDLLIPAFARLASQHPDAHLVLVGPGDSKYLQQLRALATRCGVFDRTTFTGPLQGRQKWAALAAARVFALPSYQENFGLALVEAQRMGVPVVVSRNCNIWRDLVNGGGAVACEMSPESIARAIEPFLLHAGFASQHGARGQRFVRDQFTWDAAAGALERAYDSVLSTWMPTDRS